MRITITPTSGNEVVLADDSAGAAWFAPPSDVHVGEETTIQESKPIGADRRSVFNRKNASGTLSFTIRPRYSTLALAADATWELAERSGVTGTLAVYSHGESSALSHSTRTGAVVQKAEARQIGVTVEVKYEIVF